MMRLALALTCGCGVAFAALQYRDITDQTVSSAGYSLDIDGDGTADFDFSNQGSLYPLGVIFNGAQDNIVTLSTAQWDVMKPLVLGDSIKASEFYGFGDAYLNPNYASGTFPVNVDRYLGFRFTKNNLGYFGWLRVNYNGTAVTFKDLAWNNTAGQSLKAGQMPSSTSVSSSAALSSAALSSSATVLSSAAISSSAALSSAALSSSAKVLSSAAISSSAALSSAALSSSAKVLSSAAISSSAVLSSAALSSSAKVLSSAAISSSAGLSSSAQVVPVAAGVLPSIQGSQLYLPAGQWDLKLWDMSGSLIWQKSDRAQQARWLLLDLNPGAYILDLLGESQKLQFKMIR